MTDDEALTVVGLSIALVLALVIGISALVAARLDKKEASDDE